MGKGSCGTAALFVGAFGILACACGSGAGSAGTATSVTTTSPPASSSTSPASTTSSTSATTTTTTPPPAMLPRGAQGGTSAIPWSEVGPGWLLAVWGPATGRGPGQQMSGPTSGDETTTLYLVDPLGGRYSIVTIPAGDNESLDSWSGDGHRALLTRQTSAGTVVSEVDLRNGSVIHRFTVGAGATVSYTLPTGQGVTVGLASSLARYTIDGDLQLTYPNSFPGIGSYQGSAIYSPDGTELVLGAQRGLALVGNGGSLVRTLPVPNAGGCTVKRWWRPGVALASCSGSAAFVQRLWLVPITGAAPTALTAPPAPPDLGDENAWQIASGTYVQDAGACGYQYVAKLGAGSTTSPVTLPGVASGTSTNIVGTYADKISVLATVSCGSGISLVWYDPAGNSTTVVLGPPLNGGGVIEALAYPSSGS